MIRLWARSRSSTPAAIHGGGEAVSWPELYWIRAPARDRALLGTRRARQEEDVRREVLPIPDHTYRVEQARRSDGAASGGSSHVQPLAVVRALASSLNDEAEGNPVRLHWSGV